MDWQWVLAGFILVLLGIVALVPRRCPVCQSSGAICDDHCPLRGRR